MAILLGRTRGHSGVYGSIGERMGFYDAVEMRGAAAGGRQRGLEVALVQELLSSLRREGKKGAGERNFRWCDRVGCTERHGEAVASVNGAAHAVSKRNVGAPSRMTPRPWAQLTFIHSAIRAWQWPPKPLIQPRAGCKK